MKKWLCCDKPKCSYAEVKIVQTKKPIYATSLYGYNFNSLAIYCKLKQKNILKYITSCPNYQNTTLFFVPKKPEYLPIEENCNECKTCNGTGYTIEKHYLHTKVRFERNICECCNGRGIIKK